MSLLPEKTVERLIQYRRILLSIQKEGRISLFSHHLAAAAGVHSAQVRRDLMGIGYSGSSARGYDLKALLQSIEETIGGAKKQLVVLVGIGHLGRAILDYFLGRRQNLEIVAAFDNDPKKYDRVFHGVRCYPVGEMERVCGERGVSVGILCVPQDPAQLLARRLVDAGVKGIINYTPLKLDVPPDVYIENRDMIMAVEKAAYFAQHNRERNYIHEGNS